MVEGTPIANRFEIKSKAGSGGMGVVYRAHDLHTGDWVALKLLHEDANSPEERGRFAREVSLLAELQHPGIVRYVAHGEAPGGRPFLAMEWLDGEDLGHRLARGPLRIEESLIVLQQITEALATLHHREVVHRDLKPSNLFLRNGKIEDAILLDFGIARRSFTAAALTRSRAPIGTPMYMAPEQARGEREIGPALDIFALGCVLYECLAGKPAFTADHLAAVLARILIDEPTPVSVLRPGTPAAVSALLSRMLAKAPGLRPKDAAALLKELDALGPIPSKDPAVTSLASTQRQKPDKLTDSEQSLCCVVIAAPWRVDSSSSDTVRMLDSEQRSALLLALSSLHARAEWLLDGSLFATLARVGSAIDQAAQAARCALLIKERWPEAHVVLTTGRGIVDRLLPVGEAIEQAARVLRERSSSPPGDPPATRPGVWVDELSASLLKGRFVLTEAEGVAVLRGEDASADGARPLLGKPTPCVGREQELGMLEALLSSCVEESEARVILVTAPPGMGKSRLRHEFMRRLTARGVEGTLILGNGDMMSATSPYAILGQALRRLCDVSGGGEAETQRARLSERVGLRVPAEEQARVSEFLGELCNVSSPAEESARLRAARNDPKVMKEQITQAFLDFLRAECGAGPVLLVLEDLHWGDAATIRMVDAALRDLHDQPLMVLALARPEIDDSFPRLWQGRSLQRLSLNRLSKKASERLVQQALGNDAPPGVLDRILEQAGGNALYLEELIREVAAGRGETAPKTVLAMLQARMSRLDAGVRRALRAATVFGLTFWQGGVSALLGPETSPAEVERCLQALIDAEIVRGHRESRFLGERELGFRHALMREAAYELFTDEDRAAGHRLAAHYLVGVGETDPMVIAEHFDRGDDVEGAIPHYIRAAKQRYELLDLPGLKRCVERAVQAGASGEALGALRCLQGNAAYADSMAADALRSLQEAMPLLRPGSVTWCLAMRPLISITSQTGEMALFGEVVQRFAATEPEEDARAIYVAAAMSLVMMFTLIGMRAEAESFLALGQQIDARIEPRDPMARATVSHAKNLYYRYLGDDPWMALESAAQAALAYRESGMLRDALMADQILALSQLEMGAVSEAEVTARGMLELVEKINEPLSTFVGALGHAQVVLVKGDLERLADAYEGARKAQETAGANLMFAGLAGEVVAQILAARGSLEEAEVEARRAVDSLTAIPSVRLQAVAVLVRVLLLRGSFAGARAVGEEGLLGLDALGGGGSVAIPLRLGVAEARAGTGDMEGARSALECALAQIEMRAERIPDAVAREGYITKNPENLRARELARAWRSGRRSEPGDTID